MNTDAPQAAPRHFGSGWISGTLSVVLAAIGLGAVLCFHFPSYLTVPEARTAYPLQPVTPHPVLHLVLVAGFLLGFTSVMLRQNKTLGLIGMGLVLIAALLGGSRIPIEGNLHDDYYLGLDYFLLNLIVFSLIFIPLEKLFGRLQQGGVFRKGWRTDLIYFFVSSLLVQVTTLLTLKPAFVLFSGRSTPPFRRRFGISLYGSSLSIVLLADLVQYWIHRTSTSALAVRFHAVHHLTRVMDWMSGSRLHLVDLAVTRAAIYIPAYILGFSDWVLYAYIGFVAVDSTFIHTNLRFRFGPLPWLFTTPQFHHWHHGCEPEAIDKILPACACAGLALRNLSLARLAVARACGVHSNDVRPGYFAQWSTPSFRRRNGRPPIRWRRCRRLAPGRDGHPRVGSKGPTMNRPGFASARVPQRRRHLTLQNFLDRAAHGRMPAGGRGRFQQSAGVLPPARRTRRRPDSHSRGPLSLPCRAKSLGAVASSTLAWPPRPISVCLEAS